MLTQLSQFRHSFFALPRYLRVIIYLTAVYLSYVCTLGLILPYAITTLAPEKLSTLLGRPVTLGDIRINPFNFKVEIDQLAIKEKDDKPFAGIAQVQFEIHFWRSVFNHAAVIENIHIQAPYAHIIRVEKKGKAGFNFDDILQTLNEHSSTSTETAPTEASSPVRVLLSQFVLDAGLFNFDDKITHAQVNYPNINLKLSSLDTEYLMAASSASITPAIKVNKVDNTTPNAQSTSDSPIVPIKHNHYAIQLSDDHAGEISLQGQFQLFPLKVAGDIQVAKLKLTPLWRFIDDQFNPVLTDGELSIKTQYQVDLAENGELQVISNNGQFIVEKLNVNDKDRSVVKLPMFALDGISANLKQQKVHINKLHSDGLTMSAILNQDGLDLVGLFMPKSLSASTTTTQPVAKPIDAKPADAQSLERVQVAQVEEKRQIAETDASDSADKATESELAVTNESDKTEQKTEATANVTTDATKETAADIASEANPQQPVKQTPVTTSTDTWFVQLDALNIENYDLNLSEQKLTATPQQWRVYPLNFSTKVITSTLTAPIEYELQLSLNGQGTLSSQGQVDVTGETIDANIQLDKLALTQFQPYLAPYVNIQLKSGLLSSAGKLTADAKGKAIYGGSVELDDLAIHDKLRNAPLVKWQKMNINQLDFDQQKNQIKIDHLAFNQPYAKVVIAKDRTTNISDLIVEAPAANSKTTKNTTTASAKQTELQTASKTTPELSLDIQKISFSQGSAYFADNSLTPNFASGIELLEGNITHLSSTPGTKASVDIKGKIDKYAPVTLKGDINPLLDMPYLDLDLVFKSVELTSVNPYSGTYAGYYIDKGQLSLSLNYQLDKNKLKGSNHLIIDQLKLGKPSDSDLATSLPITLAIALLQDRNGVIDLGMEVSGDLDSPSFSVGSIIMTAITNVITKAVTAPFTFLAGLIGSDETLDKISFAAGKFSLSEDEQKSLDKLASALLDRPMLKLSVEGEVDAINDSQAIAERIMKRKLAKLANIEFSALPDDLSPSQFPTQGPLADALVKLYEQEVKADPAQIKDTVIAEAKDAQLSDDEITTRWHIALYNLSVKAQNVNDGMLGNLAQERAKAVKAYLVDVKEIAPERIFLLESRVSLTQNAAQVSLTIDAQ
ncbi:MULTISPECIES: DUF748 domain-containing protein [unclassified Shewanella]|uniref:DUF748 domain-containing protein n=1 Tax=Shewanella TaxID=22 RepID=UPI0021D83EC9|nr:MULTISPECIES: DUF748 domain-containing protein [unclassified Shewanella]MCU8021223.1 DUF748 domain-containing protein [Shewanella sp. SM78]MCU8042838.1 DUF748 domain-containing protein [Shewanella sp. SM68]MCU8047212.1 DUF748 domain-containing protein [Shewanella sp. SM65]MCU8078277.1 DUF748 domain-containing protein [Shewanella sp. SM103]